MSVKYELRYKIEKFPKRVFDTYKTKEDPEIKKYAKSLSKMHYVEWVELVEVSTTETTIFIGDL